MPFKNKNFPNNPSPKPSDTLVLVGRKAITDVIEHPLTASQVQKIFLSNSQQFLINYCTEKKFPYEIKNKGWFEKQFRNLNHQNCCVYLKSKKALTIPELITQTGTKKQALILMLDQIQDPHNFGAILRTAAASGIDAVIIQEKNQVQLNSTVLKVSAGVGLLVNLIVVSNLNYALDKLKKAGFWSYASMLDLKAQNYQTIKYDKKSVLIIGSEGNGISSILAKNADFKIMIPMHQGVDSLNVSVAAGILIYKIIE